MRAPFENGIRHLLASWAKLDSAGYHPLLCHMVDVAVVADALWRSTLAPSAQRSMAGDLQLDETTAGRWVAFWAGLHDLGKASPVFQFRAETPVAVRAGLQDAGLLLPPPSARRPGEAPHGTITSAEVPVILVGLFGLGHEIAKRAATVAGGHHGVFPSSDKVSDVSRRAKGGPSWDAHRTLLAEALASLLEVPQRPLPALFSHSTAMKLAGLISVADWIGSNATYFPYANPETIGELTTYKTDREKRARDALQELGWGSGLRTAEARPFSVLFQRIKEPNALQQAVESLAQDLQEPGLVIIEAPMGEGKTEAAIYLADHWMAALGQRGAYFALPTQATSNQMFSRVHEFLSERFAESRGVVHLQLLHGHAALSAEFQTLLNEGTKLYAMAYGGGDEDDPLHGVAAAEWFTYRKRGLLAPFGVGTVDQALLAVLQTKHVFVRLFGLSHKTIVIDEAHAYDTYMTALLERLLEWLAALGSPVVVLSATLPRERSTKLVAAYARGLGLKQEIEVSHADYPRITWLTASNTDARHVQTSPRSKKELHLEWQDGRLPGAPGAPFELGERLRAALEREGGCVAVICNTVRRAQEIYLALKQQQYFSGPADDGAPELDLLHSQYLYQDRQAREQRALIRFGKPGSEVTLEDGERQAVRRPQRAVLVATQVIEQSLDLDFDLMVTEMAPVDLLLQRAGRLHRHERIRPSGLEEPSLWVMRPEVTNEIPEFERGTAHVYHPHVLLRSWLALRDKLIVSIPEDVEGLVEAVYNDHYYHAGLPAPLRREWEDTKDALEKKKRADESIASQFRILPPGYPDDILEDFNRELEEDHPSVHPTLQALTRLSDPTVPVVFLRESEAQSLRRATPPPITETKGLLRHSLSVAHKELVRVLLDEQEKRSPSGWRRSPLLRHHLLVELGAGFRAEVGKEYEIELNEELGLRIHRREEQ